MHSTAHVTAAYLRNQLNYKLYEELSLSVEHALPQLVHHTLREVEDVARQHLVAPSAGHREGRVFP